MNKLFNKIAIGIASIAMAVGVGVALGTDQKAPTRAKASGTDVTFSWSGGTASGSGTSTKITWQTNYLKIEQTKGNSQSNVNSSYISQPRFYASHVLTFTPLNNSTITKINTSLNFDGTWSTGSYSNPNWTGSATSAFTYTFSTRRDNPTILISYTSAGTNYTVTFNNNTGSGTMSNDTTTGSNYTTPSCTFTKSGYSFTAWALNSASGTQYTSGQTITGITANITLYAIWSKDGTKYELTGDNFSKTGTGTSYADYNGERTINGIGIYSYQCMMNNTSGTKYVQFKRDNPNVSFLTNTTSFGKILKITLTSPTDLLIAVSDSQFSTGTSQPTGGTAVTSGQAITGSYGYFVIKGNASSGTPKTQKITIEYEAVTTYTVTWKNWDNTTIKTDTVEEGSTPSYSGSNPTRASTDQYSYAFTGWSPTPAAIYADATYTAQFSQTVRQYDVTFNLLGHGSAIAKQTIDYGGKVTKPSDPSETGWTFGGWYKENTFTNAWDFTNDTISGATTLYAKWTQVTYTVTVSGITGGSISDAPATVVHGGDLDIHLVPSSGYVLPDSITVTMGGNTLVEDDDNGYTYDDATETNPGEIIILNVTGVIVITAACPERQEEEFDIDYNTSHCTYNGPSSMYESDEITITITPDNHYKLPESVSVTGSSNVDYDQDEGTITINGASSDLEITVICVQLRMNEISVSLTNASAVGGNPEQVEEGEEVELYFEPNSYCFFTSTISVSGAADYAWDEDEGLLLLVGGTSDISINLSATEKSLSSIEINPKTGNHVLGTTFTLPTVTATFNTGNEVVTGATYSSSGIEDGIFVSTGTVTVTVSYTFNGTTKNATYTATVTAKEIDTETVYDKVTSGSLEDGDNILIVAYCSTHTSYYGMGTYADGNNVPAKSVSLTESNTRITEDNMGDALVYTLEDSGSTDTSGNTLYYLHNGNSYLYAASSSANQLKASTKATAGTNDRGKWLITVSNGVASINAPLSTNRTVMQFNHNSGTDMFSCYASASQTSIMVFKETEVPTDTPTLIQLTATGPAENVKHVGDVLTASDFVATAHYDTGSEDDKVVDPIIESGPSQLAYGENTFVLSYTEGGVTKTCEVTVVAAEQTANLTSLSWDQGEYVIIDGQEIDFSDLGTITASYDIAPDATKPIALCTVSIFTKSNDTYIKVSDISDGATITSASHGKYLGVSYTEKAVTKVAYSSDPIYVVEAIDDVYTQVPTYTWQKVSSINIGDTIVITGTKADGTEPQELSGVSGTTGTIEAFTTNPSGVYKLTVVEGANEGQVAFKDADNNYLSHSGADKTLSVSSTLDSSSSWTVEFDSESPTKAIVTNAYSESPLQYNPGNCFRVYSSKSQQPVQFYKGTASYTPTGESFANTNAIAQKAVLEFAAKFNEDMECTNAGTTSNVATHWGQLAQTFNDWFVEDDKGLTSAQKEHALALFANAYSEDGGDSLQDMLARYDYIIHKYNSLGYKLKDFLNVDAGRPEVKGAVRFNALINFKDSGSALIIAITSIVSGLAIGGYFFLRKKKEQ